MKTRLLIARPSSAPEATQGLGRERPACSTKALPSGFHWLLCSLSRWEEEVGVEKVGISVPLLLVRASVVAVVTGLNRASYFSALAKHHYSARERLEQGFPQPFWSLHIDFFSLCTPGFWDRSETGLAWEAKSRALALLTSGHDYLYIDPRAKSLSGNMIGCHITIASCSSLCLCQSLRSRNAYALTVTA